jgi:hypothetical protein
MPNLTSILPPGSGATLANSSLTIGSTNIALGATSTTLAGLTSIGTSSLTTGSISITGSTTLPAALITTSNAMAALVIDTTKALNTKSISADSTFTFSATPAADQWFSLLVTNTDTVNARTLTIPSSYSFVNNANITSIAIPANGRLHLTWYYTGSSYIVYGDPSAAGSVTIGTTTIPFGGSVTGLAGLTSFSTATGFGASISGNISCGGSVLSSGQTSGIGYTTGAGGTVTQATSKVTGVTLNRVCGTITTAADSLAATTAATFTVTNSAVAINDVIVVNLRSGYTNLSDYEVYVGGNAAGSFQISIYNNTAAALAQALVLNFVVLKSVVA